MSDSPADNDVLRVYGVDSVRDIDRAAINDAGIAGYELMSRAARYALEVALAEFAGTGRWQILCGGGNNAGDGYVLARLASAAGIDVEVRWLGDPARMRGDAATACAEYTAAGGTLAAWDGTLDADADLIVDAMLGSGLCRDVTGRFAAAVEACNASALPLLALDVPTGLNGDSGKVLGCAVRADVTVTFVGLKPGLYLDAGPDHCGRVHFSGLSIPAACYAGVETAFRVLTPARMRSELPRRRRQAHKGDFGHVLVIGGAPGMPGAVCLAGEAALRAGAGRVSVATAAASAAVVPANRPELMCHAVEDAAGLAPLLSRATVLAIGPGLGRSAWASQLLSAAQASGLPMVVDADALNLLAERPHARADRVLTPHPGEAARLLGVAVDEVQADRRGALRQLQQRYGGAVVLKGCGTMTGCGDGPPWLCPRGNPGMATAGMGDVLTGIIAALWAQGLAPDMAAAIGVEVHARAADIAAAGGERGLLASDLLTELRPWLNP